MNSKSTPISNLQTTKHLYSNIFKEENRISKVLSKSNHSLKSNSLKTFSSKLFKKFSHTKISNLDSSDLSLTNLPLSKSMKSSNVIFNISECDPTCPNFDDVNATKITSLKRSQSDSTRQKIEKSEESQTENRNRFFSENQNALFHAKAETLVSEKDKNAVINNSNSSFNNSLDSLLMNMDKVPSVPNMKAILSQYPEYQIPLEKASDVCAPIILIILVMVVLVDNA